MPSIAIVNNKGGVGKTTVSVNLAAALARRQKKVLLVDLDGQGNASLFLGIDPYRISPNTSDIFLNGTSLRKVRYEVMEEGFDISPAGPNLYDVDQALANYPQKKLVLRKAMEDLPPYDFILIDAPPALGLITTSTLSACDYFIVPMTPDYLAYEALLAFLGAVEQVENSGGPVASFLGILFNLVDLRLKVSKEIMEFVRKHFPDDVFKTFVKSNARLQEAPYHRKSIFGHDHNGEAALGFEMLAGEVIRRLQEDRAHTLNR